jgi:hypothetical protein
VSARQQTERERAYREVLPELDGAQLTQLALHHVDDAPLRNVLVTLIALQSGQTREQVFNALADLYALRLIFGLSPQGRDAPPEAAPAGS